MKIIYTTGTFDLFSAAHLSILERAKSYGTYLIVGVSSDKFNAIKNKKAIYSQEDRMKIVAALKCVDEVRLEESFEEKEQVIIDYNIDEYIIGDDPNWLGTLDYLSHLCTIRYLPRTEGTSTTETKKRIKEL